MEKFLITGGNQLRGSVTPSGAKNVALKLLVAACLTDEEVRIHNVPLIADVYVMIDLLKELGATVQVEDHTIIVRMEHFATTSISLDKAAHARTSAMFIAPLLAREKTALIPNPGGCRLGARPIDRIIDGVSQLNAEVSYVSGDGFFHAKTDGLRGMDYTFEKNTHMGTETLIIAAVLAEGMTVLRNAAEEPEIGELIDLLNKMGARIRRTEHRVIEIEGVKKLHGAEVTIKPDRNEIITFAIAALVTKGDVTVHGAQQVDLKAFLDKLGETKAGFERTEGGIRFYHKDTLQAVDITTAIYPGFMTDWQAPWAVLMTQAEGTATIHETVFENKLGYIKDLKKMGAKADLFNPNPENPAEVYNFNLEDDSPSYFHAVKITGPAQLHNAIVTMLDIRAGAAVVLAALAAKGETTIHGVHLVDRGYEKFEERLASLGADIKRVNE
jgi:UDP-N-acetylglucosamine 1-carboxyvinyltransferase